MTTVPPDSASSVWHDAVRTTTLEGGHDWDTWIQEGATGYDTEFLRAGEPTPWTMAGFVHQVGNPVPRVCDPTKPGGAATSCGSIYGRVLAAKVYIPQNGGAAYNGTQYGGGSGAKPDGPINRPWVAISDLRGVNDQLVALVRGNADGTFRVDNLPASDYSVTIWDDDQDYLLDTWNVTVGRDLQGHAKSVDMGTPMLAGWFTDVHGTVFVDANANGRQDPGENGVPNFTLTLTHPQQHADGPGHQPGHDRHQRSLRVPAGLPVG